MEQTWTDCKNLYFKIKTEKNRHEGIKIFLSLTSKESQQVLQGSSSCRHCPRPDWKCFGRGRSSTWSPSCCQCVYVERRKTQMLFIKSCMSSWHRWKLTRWQYKERRWGEDSQFWTSAEESLLQQWVCPFPSGSLSQAPVQSHWPGELFGVNTKKTPKKGRVENRPEGQLCCIEQHVPIVPKPPSFDPSPTTNWETQESTWRAY